MGAGDTSSYLTMRVSRGLQMTKTLITRFTRISGYRVFQDWSDDGKADSFERINVIYGTNGSGKSTLAHLFRTVADAAFEQQTVLEFAGVTGTREIKVTEQSSDFWSCVRVFNDNYVSDILRFDDIGGPSPDSLLTLGAVNVVNENELDAKRVRRETARGELSKAEADRLGKTKSLDRRLSSVALELVTELSGSGVSRYRATNVYNKGHVRSLLEGSSSNLSDVSDSAAVSKDLKLALSPKPDRMLLRSQQPVNSAVVERAVEILDRSFTSVVINELRDSPVQAAWVEQGVHLHADRTMCLFCGGPVTAERRKTLDADFDDALTRLQADLARLVSELEAAVRVPHDFLREARTQKSAYPDLQQRYTTALEAFEAGAITFQATVERLLGLLREKEGSPFTSKWLSPETALASPEPIELVTVVNEHNDRVEQHGQHVDQAAARVELGRVGAFKPEYEGLKSSIAEATALEGALRSEVQDLTNRIVVLENVETDPVPKADALTSHIARLLGRSDLAFRMDESTKRYKIERSGLPATHLSEGERTAIALLHFLLSVREDSIAGDPPIIVIDDPVSSLDDSILFGVSSYLWAELVSVQYASQVFLLTHKFELFRQWVIQIENGRRFIEGGATIQEIRMRHEIKSGEIRRVPRITTWTSDKHLSKRLRSLYHFLFARVGGALIESKNDLGLAERMELLTLVPNAARKMLEGFLSFRYPGSVGDFHAGMRAALQSVDDAAVRNRVERYLHAYSHNEEGDISAMVDPAEVGPVVQSLFEMMKAVDEKHFEAMCAALELDSAALVHSGVSSTE